MNLKFDSAALHILFSQPAHRPRQPGRPALGASGAVLGMYGFLWATFKRRRDERNAQAMLRYMVTVLIYGFLARG